MEITTKNGIYYLSGRLDEFADFSIFDRATSPLKMNLGRIASINSIGVRRFLAFSLAWSPRVFEFYECTPEFIANVNVIPQMLGRSGDETQVKTFYIPYSCESCRRIESVLCERALLQKTSEGEIILGEHLCGKCREPMDLDVEKAEFFTFLSAG